MTIAGVSMCSWFFPRQKEDTKKMAKIKWFPKRGPGAVRGADRGASGRPVRRAGHSSGARPYVQPTVRGRNGRIER